MNCLVNKYKKEIINMASPKKEKSSLLPPYSTTNKNRQESRNTIPNGMNTFLDLLSIK